jgi:paraquat-inducible protein A
MTHCPDCGLVQELPVLKGAETARCGRCGAFLRSGGDLGNALALTFAALFLFAIANALPFMTFEFDGSEQTAYVLTGVSAFYSHGFVGLGMLVLFASFVAPLVRIMSLLYVLLPLQMGFVPWGVARVFRFTEALRSWGMLEVYLIGVLVAVVKLGELASVSPGMGFYFFLPLVYVWTAVPSQIDPQVIWAAADKRIPPPVCDSGAGVPQGISCDACGRVGGSPASSRQRCVRCGAPLHARKPNSVARTWALVLTAAILYIPANVYPIMTVTLLGQTEKHTILDGVETLFAAGLWEIGAVVFVASIAVPLLKLVGLSHLLISMQWGQPRRTEVERTRLYRVIAYIGRWSMIDMFMLSILIALVHLGTLATIDPGIAATCFAGVVVITIFAAESFDSRMIWDRRGGQE